MFMDRADMWRYWRERLTRLSIARRPARSSETDGDTICSSMTMPPAAVHGGRWLHRLTICSRNKLALSLLAPLDAMARTVWYCCWRCCKFSAIVRHWRRHLDTTVTTVNASLCRPASTLSTLLTSLSDIIQP